MKKKQTPDEQLQQALVPKQDWPYDVPGTWCWVHLLETFENKTDSKRKVKTKEYLENGILPVIDQSQIFINGYTDNESMAYQGSLPVIIFGDHTRNIKYVDFNFAQGADGVKVLKSKPFFHPKAFYYALKNLNIPNLGYRRHFPLFPKFMLPLPPFNEQKRIIAEVEKMYAKLDEAQEKIESVVASFETRKAAILHAAFTGKLTAKWREEQGITTDSKWIFTTFSNIAKVKSNLVNPNDYVDYPHIAPDNIEKKTGRLLEYRTIREDDVHSPKHHFFPGQILYSKIRPYLSKVVIVDFEGLCSADMYPIDAVENVDNEYLWYYMLSDDFLNQASTAGSRTVLPKINQKELAKICVPITCIEEQREIVRLLDDLLAKEQAAKEKAEAVLGQIDTLKKSILARAFRGQLGTTDPSDTPAIEELKQYVANHL